VLPQILTLIGTLVGAALGLSASLLTSLTARRDNDLRLQREVAGGIMALFEDGRSPAELLRPRESPSRRKLYLLALRLENSQARNACMAFLACAGDGAKSDGELDDAWNTMMFRVGAVYRHSRKDS
jgi:hypothetical protein